MATGTPGGHALLRRGRRGYRGPAGGAGGLLPRLWHTPLVNTLLVDTLAGCFLGYLNPNPNIPPPWGVVQSATGWTYTAAWSLSFYPQVSLAYRILHTVIIYVTQCCYICMYITKQSPAALHALAAGFWCWSCVLARKGQAARGPRARRVAGVSPSTRALEAHAPPAQHASSLLPQTPRRGRRC